MLIGQVLLETVVFLGEQFAECGKGEDELRRVACSLDNSYSKKAEFTRDGPARAQQAIRTS